MAGADRQMTRDELCAEMVKFRTERDMLMARVAELERSTFTRLECIGLLSSALDGCDTPEVRVAELEQRVAEDLNAMRDMGRQFREMHAQRDMLKAQVAEMEAEHVNMQCHRDAWRGYAYGTREKPTDFLDGNMVERGSTLVETLQARIAELERQIAEHRSVTRTAPWRMW